MELRDRSRAQYGRRRAIHSAGEHRRHRRGRSPGAGQIQSTAFQPAAGRRRADGVCAAAERLHAGSPVVNAQIDSPARPDVAAPAVDERNPWLGLASFTEETRAYFYGREDEVAELARRVQRKLLTVLFGQSGLGKTSILRAGLVPRLRAQGYCPVYVRVDYGRDAPEPTDQIKQAIARTARRAGEWTQVGAAPEEQPLWGS